MRRFVRASIWSVLSRHVSFCFASAAFIYTSIHHIGARVWGCWFIIVAVDHVIGVGDLVQIGNRIDGICSWSLPNLGRGDALSLPPSVNSRWRALTSALPLSAGSKSALH